MEIIYFGNRAYSKLVNLGHTRFEHIFKQMVINPRVKKLYYFNPPKSMRLSISSGFMPKIVKIDKKLTIVETSFFLPRGFINPINNYILYHLIKIILNKIESKERIIWSVWGVSEFGWPQIVYKLKSKIKIQDFVELPHSLLGLKSNISLCYELVAKNFDYAFVNSQRSLSYFKNEYKNNSCEYFCIYNGIPLIKQKFEKKNNDEVVIGTVSIFSPFIIDYNFLYKIIKENNDWTFTLIGHVLKTTMEIHSDLFNQIKKLPNSNFVGFKQGKDLDEELANLSWGLSPIVNDDKLIFGDSMKKYLFLSRNVPVLSTEPMEKTHPLYNSVYHVAGMENKKIRELIKNPPRINPFFSTDHTWNNRLNRMLDIIDIKK